MALTDSLSSLLTLVGMCAAGIIWAVRQEGKIQALDRYVTSRLMRIEADYERLFTSLEQANEDRISLHQATMAEISRLANMIAKIEGRLSLDQNTQRRD